MSLKTFGRGSINIDAKEKHELGKLGEYLFTPAPNKVLDLLRLPLPPNTSRLIGYAKLYQNVYFVV